MPPEEMSCEYKRIVALSEGNWGMRDWKQTTLLEFTDLELAKDLLNFGLYRLKGSWKPDRFCVSELELLSPSSEPEAALRELASAGGPERALFSEAEAKRIRLRTKLLRRARTFLDERGFEEIEVPNMVAEPGCDPNIRLFKTAFEPLAGAGEAKSLYLQTSPEISLKRMLVAGADAIYRAGPVFRNGERSPRHEPEFMMVEWYRVGATLDDLKEEATALITALFEEARSFGFEPPRIPVSLASYDLCQLFQSSTGVDPLKHFDGQKFAQELSDAGLGPFSQGCSYQEAFYQAVVERLDAQFNELGSFYVENFPAPLAVLSRRSPENPRVARRVEGYIHGVEFANGFEELRDPVEQKERFEEDLAIRKSEGWYLPPIPKDFLKSLEAGMPPAAGIAVGLDRIIQLACEAKAIQGILPLTP